MSVPCVATANVHLEALERTCNQELQQELLVKGQIARELAAGQIVSDGLRIGLK